MHLLCRPRYREGVPFRNSSVVVFSDVDWPVAHSFESGILKAAKTLEQLRASDVALVLFSGKTRAELEFIRDRLAISDPFICENGAAVIIPRGYFGWDLPNSREIAGYQAFEFGQPYVDVVGALRRTAGRLKLGVMGFADMSIDEVARECDIPLMQARLAKLRDYSELFRLVSGDVLARRRLLAALQMARLDCTPGYAFDAVGARVDRKLGVNLLTNLFRREVGEFWTVTMPGAFQQDNLFDMADHHFAKGVSSCAPSDALSWAERIVSAVRHVREANAGTLAAASGGRRSLLRRRC